LYPHQNTDPFWFGRIFSQPGCPVRPIAVKGAFVAFDFGMALDFGMDMVEQGIVAVGEFDGTFSRVSFPIAIVDPFPPFAGVMKTSPFGQFPEQFLV
jgi:hypothetical protein